MESFDAIECYVTYKFMLRFWETWVSFYGDFWESSGNVHEHHNDLLVTYYYYYTLYLKKFYIRIIRNHYKNKFIQFEV